jgi:hypothetical protein
MIQIEAASSLDVAVKDELDHLNRASARRCPFATPQLLETHVAHDDAFRTARPVFLLARECGRLAGVLPLRATTQKTAGVPWTKLEWALTLEVDRPHLVCHPDDEDAIARAMWRWLCAPRRRWSMLELSQQDEGAAMRVASEAIPASRFFARTLPSRDGNVLRLVDDAGAPRFADVGAYLQALSRKQRSNVKRAVLDTLARPGTTLVSSTTTAAARRLFELYLDVERRSWKVRGDAAIVRNPSRVAYYQALLDERQPLSLQVDVLLDQGVPVAGHVTGTFEGATYFMQTVHDERLDDVSPGSLMLLWSVKQAIDAKRAAFNMLPDFSYYKARWLADVVPTTTLQVFKKGTLPWTKAVLGDWKRRLAPPPPQTEVLQNASKQEAELKRSTTPPPPDRELAARVLVDAERLGIRSWTAEELLRALPFDGAVRAKSPAA